MREIESQVFSSIDDFRIPHIRCKNKPTFRFKNVKEMNEDGRGKQVNKDADGNVIEEVGGKK